MFLYYVRAHDRAESAFTCSFYRATRHAMPCRGARENQLIGSPCSSQLTLRLYKESPLRSQREIRQRNRFCSVGQVISLECANIRSVGASSRNRTLVRVIADFIKAISSDNHVPSEPKSIVRATHRVSYRYSRSRGISSVPSAPIGIVRVTAVPSEPASHHFRARFHFHSRGELILSFALEWHIISL